MIKQENLAIVTLKKGEGRTIKAGGAWVFNNEIETFRMKWPEILEHGDPYYNVNLSLMSTPYTIKPKVEK